LAGECADGNDKAIALLQARYGGLVEGCASRMKHAVEPPEDYRRAFFTVICEPREGGRPRIAGYTGRGSLGGWIKVVAVRQNLRRSPPQAVPPDPGGESGALADEDPELEFLRQQYGNVFAAAFEAAVAELTPRERNLLRYSVVDGLSIEQIAAIHH
jgi:RNA polymerase sigma-70 factor (ECF subfamily)